ncbi:MAG: hypothetical protein HFI29_00825 [Lachnospiraceae bacterium]|jgi:hypothetical protein|nr:hypothetical protein [Lachnospiraceae bacterium]
MTKRIIACLLTVGILGGLAYYSGFLYTETKREEELRLKAPIALFLQEERMSYQQELKEQERRERELETLKQEAAAQAEAVHTEAEPYLYYLVSEEGYVNIYLADGETLYEETEITLEDLPEDLKGEVLKRKGLSSTGELYDFLENYSS